MERNHVLRAVQRNIDALRTELDTIPADARRVYLQIADRIREAERQLRSELNYKNFLEGKGGV